MVKDLLKMRCPLCGGWIYENRLDKNLDGFDWCPKVQVSVWDKHKRQGNFLVSDSYDSSRTARFKRRVKERLIETLKVLFGFDVCGLLKNVPLHLSGNVNLKEPRLNIEGDLQWKS